MARKKRRKRPPTEPTPIASGETRAADAVTIAWMLSVVTALLCELGAVAAVWVVAASPDSINVAALGDVLVFSALVIGTLSLGMAVVAWKVRRESPPVGVTVFAVAIGSAPLLLLVGRMVRRWLV